jgi:hypothetical protein
MREPLSNFCESVIKCLAETDGDLELLQKVSGKYQGKNCTTPIAEEDRDTDFVPFANITDQLCG